jgi:osmotically-inducible protein OsmY
MKKLITLVGLALTLQGCIFVAGAAAGAAAIAVVYDHRTIKLTLDDTNIANSISDKLSKIQALKQDGHVEVTVFNGVVLLTGQTPSQEARQQAGEIARSTKNVFKVYNQINIEAPTSSLTRTSDAWISTKIRTEMLARKNLKSSSIKVVTENGIVYLMGIVTEKQANVAVDIARQVSGVQKVVKIFEYTKAKPEGAELDQATEQEPAKTFAAPQDSD